MTVELFVLKLVFFLVINTAVHILLKVMMPNWYMPEAFWTGAAVMFFFLNVLPLLG